MTGRLDGKIAIIIGGARGIGAGACEVFVREGARVLLADIETKQGEGVVARFPDRATFMTADISKRADMQRLAAAALERYGRIDILAQVAGIYPNHLIEDLSEEEWDRVLDINLKGAFLAIQACFPAMKEQRYGRIVLMGSITGPIVSQLGYAHYSASKAGLVGLAKAAAVEGAAHGIAVNVVEPGNVETESARRAMGDAGMDKMAEAALLKRLAQPVEIGEAMAFLASDQAAYITGTTLVLDGGQTLPEARL
jgi:3-oxoacyl-[acyl-carrier protein] reductase